MPKHNEPSNNSAIATAGPVVALDDARPCPICDSPDTVALIDGPTSADRFRLCRTCGSLTHD